MPDAARSLEATEAAQEIGRLATRIVKLAPIAGLYVGIEIKPASDLGELSEIASQIIGEA